MTNANQVSKDLMRPWERLHTVNLVDMPGLLTVEEALRHANQDWEVHKVSLLTNQNVLEPLSDEVDKEQSERLGLFGIENPQMAMTVRVDFLRDEQGKKTNVITNRSYLGTVGVGYGVVQNHEYAAFFDEALGEKAACVTSAGTLGRFGARVFLVATLPDMLELVPGDPIERHIMLTTTHDGSGPVEVMFIAWSPARNCMVYVPGARKRIRHTKNADQRIKNAKRVLHDNETYWARARRTCEYLNSQNASERRRRDFVEAMFPDKASKDPETGETIYKTTPQAQRLRDEVIEIATSPLHDLPKTDYGLFLAACLWVDHYRKRKKNKKNAETHTSTWEVSVFGPGADFRDKAFRWLESSRKIAGK